MGSVSYNLSFEKNAKNGNQISTLPGADDSLSRCSAGSLVDTASRISSD